ncbi:MAG: lysophospholipid acyltransferase family protein [Acidobacteriota bacterium]|nr:lysophospholipid acyltransferase family protein [Acidobacteriota bacterium]
MRSLLRALFARALRVFFRRIEVEGAERVPKTGPAIFVVNHPNALVDPVLLLCFSPRPISFLAKAPLFRMPVVGLLVRTFDSIPVYRAQDGADQLVHNRETFESAGRVLVRGGTLALFPEGISHDEPRLAPLKSGAARIAIGTATSTGSPLSVVPAGLYYTWKNRFRSSALLAFGEPLSVPPGESRPGGEPDREAVEALTDRISAAMSALTLQADTRGAMDLVRRAEKIFGAGADGPRLADELSRRQRFVEGYRRLAEADPARLAALEGRIRRFEAERREAGLSVEHLSAEALSPRALATLIAENLGTLVLLPFAAAGALLHYPAYRLSGILARRLVRHGEDVLATVKVASSMLLFPLTWAAASWGAWRLAGPAPGLAAIGLVPFCGWAALRAAESLDTLLGRAWALTFLLFRETALRRLLAERAAIQREIAAIAEELRVES